MTTKILHCGFVDPTAADPIETLLDLMTREPLEPWLEPFLEPPDVDGVVKIGGGFFSVTFAFTIHTDDATLLDRFRVAIAANIARPDYLDAKRERAEQDAAREARFRAFLADARAR